jgi:hypothetical protein
MGVSFADQFASKLCRLFCAFALEPFALWRFFIFRAFALEPFALHRSHP